MEKTATEPQAHKTLECGCTIDWPAHVKYSSAGSVARHEARLKHAEECELYAIFSETRQRRQDAERANYAATQELNMAAKNYAQVVKAIKICAKIGHDMRILSHEEIECRRCGHVVFTPDE